LSGLIMGGGGAKPRIGGITDMSTVDWYGNVSLVVFFAGCNLRCPYCQNSGLIPIDSGEEVDLELIRQRIEMNMSPVPELDSVVLTGGEPLLQPEGVIEVAKLVKGYELKLMLDTNGSRVGALKGILESGLIDRVALDVKAPLAPEDYGRVIGHPKLGGDVASAVERSLILCEEHGVEVEARTTVAPTVSEDAEFIRRISRSVKGRCSVYYLQQYDNTGDVLSPLLKGMAPPDRARMIELAHVALEEGVEGVYIKTRERGLERVG